MPPPEMSGAAGTREGDATPFERKGGFSAVFYRRPDKPRRRNGTADKLVLYSLCIRYLCRGFFLYLVYQSYG